MIRWSRENIIKYAQGYDNNYSERYSSQIEEKMKQKLKEQDYLTRNDFVEIGRWKSPRPSRYYEANSEDFVREVTAIAFNAQNEKIKIEALYSGT